MYEGKICIVVRLQSDSVSVCVCMCRNGGWNFFRAPGSGFKQRELELKGGFQH